jgi:putative membrane protein
MIEWMKALHIISVIAWMAGMFYLPRLFVYHSKAETGSEQSETFKVMERKLLRIIMGPAMIASWIFGLGMVFGFGLIDFAWGWVWVKFVAVVAMTGVHVFLAMCVRDFANDANQRPERFYRMINEVPTVLMIIIVIMVIVRPF